MTKFFVTLKSLREAGACYEGYNKVVRMLQGIDFTDVCMAKGKYINYSHSDEISLIDICNNNGLDDALWALRCVPDVDRDARMFAVWCARQVEHLMEDQRSKDALDVAERCANGQATEEELYKAWNAALAAVDVGSEEARAAARSANYAAREVAVNVSNGTVWYAVRQAANYAAIAAVSVDNNATRYTAMEVANGTVWDTVVSSQKEMFIRMCNGEAPWHAEG